MLTTNDIPLSQSALLVVDAQDSFKVGPRWEQRNNHDLDLWTRGLTRSYIHRR